MISHRNLSRLPAFAVATVGSMIAYVAWAADALAYPAGDGPDMHSSVPGNAPSAAAAGTPMWTFLVLIAVTAAVAVLSTLTVLRTSGRMVSTATRPAHRGIDVFAAE